MSKSGLSPFNTIGYDKTQDLYSQINNSSKQNTMTLSGKDTNTKDKEIKESDNLLKSINERDSELDEENFNTANNNLD